jgi:antitoxin PrlF
MLNLCRITSHSFDGEDAMGKRYQSRMTSKGQVTIPAELRKELGLNAGDQVEFVMDNGSVCVRRAESVVLRTARSVIPPPGARKSDHQIREEVERAIADEAIRRGRMFVKD